MITLQKTLRYAGEVRTAPFADVELKFQIPAFRYLSDRARRIVEDGATSVPKVVRRNVGTESVSVATTVAATSYRVELDDALLAGEDKTLLIYYIQGAASAGSIEDLFVTVNVDYVAAGLSVIGRQTLDLLYYTKILRGALVLNAQVPEGPHVVLLIDRGAFFRLHKKLTEMVTSFNPVLLLEIIATLADNTRGHPTLDTRRSAPARQSILASLSDARFENPAAALEVIEKSFESLFDIALTIPEAEIVSIAGTFTIETTDQTAILPKDLLLYDLTAEYSVRYSGELRVLRHSFKDVTALTNNSTPFALAADSPIFREAVASSIHVKVRGFDGSIVWSRDCQPTDASLAHLDIKVPLLRPNTLVTAEEGDVRDNTKRLRGQVLDLSQKCCSLKDLTILVQAKSTADQPWRIVGATTTDSSGNFSMPYPYGIYTAAQAIVSLKPDDPTDIPVSAARDGNQTICDDFIYLVLRDGDCTHDEDDKDCSCQSGNKASRLPDFADLIGSDQYSQDIGSGCVNLSTPNRTLSEFNYQAIVRISDPEVANYSLQKIEPQVEDVSSVLNRLRASNAHTNQVIGVLGGLNAELNAALGPINGASNAASNALLIALGAVVSPLNAALMPLYASPVAALSAALDSLNDAVVASDAFNAKLNSAVLPMKKAIADAVRAANEALEAAIAAAKPTEDLLGVLAGPQSDWLNVLFNPLNVAVSASIDPEKAAAAREAREKLYNSLANANAALNEALNASQITLSTAMTAASAVSDADVSTRYELVGGNRKIARRTVDLDNPVAWQDAPDVHSSEGMLLRQERAIGATREPHDLLSGAIPASNKKNLNFYQAVTVATGHILHYKALFKADGYSLGDLLYSLPLAPGQKKQVVVLDASHTLQGAESQLLAQGERLSAGIADERQLLTQLSGTLSESLRGSSTANTSGISAGFGTGGQGYGGTGAYGGSGSAVIGVAGGTANANSNAAQDSSRTVTEFFAEKLRQSIMQNAESYRQLNASVVTTVQEGQRYGVTSDVVANHNHCHALTMMYFEVLRHYAVYQKLAAVEECVFVPLLMTNFTTQNIFKWRDVLARFLLPMPSDTYLQGGAGAGSPHPLIKAFDANERLRSRYANVDFPEGAYDDEQIQFVRGSLRLRVNLPRPRTRFDRILSFPLTKQLDAKAMASDALKYSQDMATYSVKVAATGGLLALFDGPPNPPNPTQYEVVAREAIFDAFMSLDANFDRVPPAQCIRIKHFKPAPSVPAGVLGLLTAKYTTPLEFFAENTEDRAQWQIYADVLGYPDVLTMLNAYFAGNLISEWDSIFHNDIVPVVFEKIISSLALSEIATDFSCEAKYKGGERLVRLNVTGTTSRKRNQLPLRLRLGVTNSQMKSLQDFATLDVQDVTLRYSTAHYEGLLYSGSVNSDLLDGAELYIPESAEEKRNLRKEDAYLVGKLIEHLNSNLEHYNKVLWYNLDADRRYMLLDGFGIQTYNDSGLPLSKDNQRIALRSLASVVKNELVAIVGNSMVFPVAAGYRVGKDFVSQLVPMDTEPVSGREPLIKQRRVGLLDHYKPLTPIEPFRISVPTKGVFVEAVQGACNACEKIETDRVQDWTRFPNPDEPTAIGTVTPPTPGVTDWRAAFKDLAAPIVNIQNAPGAPAPGAGLEGVAELLGKGEVFKDITGLDRNQKNALQTYLSNQENAMAFAEMAKEMAMQSHNTQNSGNIMDSIMQARESGDITEADASMLMKDHIQQKIDGGLTKRAELAQARQAQTGALTQAAVEAASQGRSITAQAQNPEGSTESVTIGAGPSAAILAEAKNVTGVAQPNENSCWAAVATMMCMWQAPQLYQSIDDVMAAAGDKFVQLYDHGRDPVGRRLPTAYKTELLSQLRMTSEPGGTSYPLQSYIDWLKAYGPLWIAIDANADPEHFSAHAVLLVRITGTGTPDGRGTDFTYIDPEGARTITVPFSEFVASFEGLAKLPSNMTPSIQVVHFSDLVGGGDLASEGGSSGGGAGGVGAAIGGAGLEQATELAGSYVKTLLAAGSGTLQLPSYQTFMFAGTKETAYQSGAPLALSVRRCQITFDDIAGSGPGEGLSGVLSLEWISTVYTGPITSRTTAADRTFLRSVRFAKGITGSGTLTVGGALETADVQVTLSSLGLEDKDVPPYMTVLANISVAIKAKSSSGDSMVGRVVLALHPDAPLSYRIRYVRTPYRRMIVENDPAV